MRDFVSTYPTARKRHACPMGRPNAPTSGRGAAVNTRDEIRDAVERYGRECQNAVESFRCAEPDLDAVMALIEPHLVIAEAARKWVASRPKGGVAAVAICGTVHTVATYEQVKAEAALRAAVDAEQVGGE